MSTLALARFQFALTIAFHYIYPPLSIGLGVVLVIMEGLWIKTRNPLYRQMTHFWVKVFGLVFSIGVATGIVMEFEFGTNWSTYSRYVGDVFGSALASEAIFAFFLESGFLSILLFGWDRVPSWLHFLSTVLVAAGAHFSAVWIVVANSWMQTPAGYHIVGEGLHARAEITDFWAMVFNPSSVDRLTHVYLAAWQAGAWLVLSVSAFYLLKKRHIQFARASMKIGLIVAVISSVGQLLSGHHSARGVSRNQPEKLAAFEGHFAQSAPAGVYLLGWVNDKEEHVTGIRIPGMLSWLTRGGTGQPLLGLKAFDPADRPPVNFTFQTYHLMVTTGLALIALSVTGLLLWWRGTLFTSPWILRLYVIAVLGPQIANQAGWFTAEVGRQPWIVYHLLHTSEGLSKVVKSQMILGSIIMFGLLYLLLFALFIFLLDQKIRHGPDDLEEKPSKSPLPFAGQRA